MTEPMITNKTTEEWGPSIPISKELHQQKYRAPKESFREATARIANALKDSEPHYHAFKTILRHMRFLPGGRIQAAVGAAKTVTPYNCFVSCDIEDSMRGIMGAVAEAAETMRLGGGIGYDFSTIRPRGDNIVSLASPSSGPVSFMQIFDATCKTISSSGHRRGAQMGVLRVDHPDIEEFIRAKQDGTSLTAFNVSVGVTDEFMNCIESSRPFELKYGGKVYKKVDAKSLWDEIMRSTWDYAEPGVLFIDRINQDNPASYCETITATNPCGEQPLPAHGACLLGSFNLTKYLVWGSEGDVYFNYDLLAQDVPHVVRAMDNVIDIATYPLSEQRAEAKQMRRMGLGVTGLANAGELLGFPYGSEGFLGFTDKVLQLITTGAYSASADLAVEKGPFPKWQRHEYGATVTNGPWIYLPKEVQTKCILQGLRNSHLTSIAPTGTISLCADNVSSGIEPVFSHKYERVIQTFDGPIIEEVRDWAYSNHYHAGKTAEECTIDDHLGVLLTCQKWMDSAVSKTCNIGDDVSWEDFKEVYVKAWKGGAKGCTTFRSAGKRKGILLDTSRKDDGEENLSCSWDEFGNRTCE